MPELQQITADPSVPALAAILDPIVLRNHIAPAVGRPEPQRVYPEMLSAHPGSRYTLAIRIKTASGSRELIGKAYAADRRDVAEAMDRLWRAGFDDRAECSIPQPLAYIEPLHLLLQERVSGPVAQQFFLGEDEGERRYAAARCAGWLACFHRTAPAVGPPFRIADYFSALDRWQRRIGRLGDDLGEKAVRLVAGLEREACFVKEAVPAAGHGSFSPGQIIFAAGRTVTFDWDGYDVADPARDVARFRVALRRLALGRLGSIRALDGCAEHFLEEYLTAGGPDVRPNLRFFEAALCVQLAKYNIAHPVSHWREKLDAMLDEGMRLLEAAR